MIELGLSPDYWVIRNARLGARTISTSISKTSSNQLSRSTSAYSEKRQIEPGYDEKSYCPRQAGSGARTTYGQLWPRLHRER
jgi:hypothetical protein